MSFNKSFFVQNNKDIRQELKDYKAFGEYKDLKFKKCKHSDVAFANGELRCSCGAAWTGPRLQDLLTKLKGGSYAQA